MRKYLLQFLYEGVLRNMLRIVVGVQFGKSSFLKGCKQFIIVANHNSHLDTMSLLAALPGNLTHMVKPVAAMDYFGKTRFKAWLSNYFINTLLITRSSGGAGSIHQMVEALDKGYSLIIFPEGTRGDPEVMQPLKRGVGVVLAQRPHIPYVPVFMTGMGKAMPKGDPIIVPHIVKIAFGKPVLVNSTDPVAIMAQIEADLLTLRDGS
jgi:1-acyl-sn-glycerol-3-phosphate acyltransferase